MSWIPPSVFSNILNHKRQVLLFTACQSGTGTTHAIVECAQELARQYPDMRILLADFRLGNNALSAKGASVPGWQQSLKKSASLQQSITALECNSNIALVASNAGGDGSCSSLELRAAFECLLQETRDAYDVVLVDAPPVLPEQHESFLCQKSDGVVLVVAAGQSRRPVIKEAAASIQKQGGNLLGVILNRRKKLIPQWIYDRCF